jgi:hypothetical protein
VTRRIVFALLLALAAAAYFVIRSAPRPGEPKPQGENRSGPHADIDDASRAALEKILEDADRKQDPRR